MGPMLHLARYSIGAERGAGCQLSHILELRSCTCLALKRVHPTQCGTHSPSCPAPAAPRLEAEVASLEAHLDGMRSVYMLNADKLEYNVRVLCEWHGVSCI